MPPKATRSDTICWLLGQVEKELGEEWILNFLSNEGKKEKIPLAFKGNRPKLPSKGQVLKLMMYCKKSERMKMTSTSEIAEFVLEEVYRYWKMANIPVQVHFYVKKRLLQIHNDYSKLSINKKRDTDTEKKKRENFQEDLDKLFDIASSDAEEEIGKDRHLEKESRCEDLIFLEDQRGDRLWWISIENVDKKYSASLKAKNDRVEVEENQKEKEKQRRQDSSKIKFNNDIHDGSDDEDFVPKKNG